MKIKRNNEEEKRQRGLEEGTVRKIVTGTIVGAIVIGILITFVFNRGVPTVSDEDVVEEPPQEEELIEDDRDKILEKSEGAEDSAEDDTEKEVEDTVETRAEKSREEAKANLEKADRPVEVSEEEMAILTEDLQKLFDHLGQDFSDVEGNYFASKEYANSIAGQTEPYMGQQINIAQKDAGYKMAPETAEWFYSDTEEVYQFTVSMKAEGRDDLVFSGNYNKDQRFFKVFKMHGDLYLDDLVS